ncbi:MAG: hypothetical protein HYX79_06085 [Chloroflexi bacterium]|nr:hypothetical protein [Chloroflexota bacterium]
MKYRVRLDLSFDNQRDAQALLDYARAQSGKATSINEGQDNEEISFCEYELCGHDEGLPCTSLEKLEVRKLSSG